MGRKKKFVNKTHYPDWAIERFTRCIFEDVLAFFSTEEGLREYAAWEAEQAGNNPEETEMPAEMRVNSVSIAAEKLTDKSGMDNE